MSFFAYLAVANPSPADQTTILELLAGHGFKPEVVNLSVEHGVTELYGLTVDSGKIFEVELLAQDAVSIEVLLLDPQDPNARWAHYQACAALLDKQVRDFHEDDEVEQLFANTVLELRVVEILRELAQDVVTRPIILNLDPDFEMRLGNGVELRGFEQITRGVWAHTYFSDLETPLRLIIAE